MSKQCSYSLRVSENSGNNVYPGAPFLGGSGGSSPPKIRRKEAKNSPERGAQAPQYSSHAGKMTLFKPFRTSLSKKFFETPQYFAPNGAPGKISSWLEWLFFREVQINCPWIKTGLKRITSDADV